MFICNSTKKHLARHKITRWSLT